jgi:hypothetical protein
MKTVLSFLALMITLGMSAQQGSGRIKVTVMDEKLVPMPGAVVRIVAGGPQLGGTTDLDGNFTFAALNPGGYDVECRVAGYKKYTKTGIQVSAGQTAYAQYNMQIALDTTEVIVIRAVQSPVDPTFTSIQNINANQIKTMASDRGNVVGMITGTNSQVSQGKNGQLVMRGSREGASAVYVDGEKMYGSMGVPALSMNQVSVLSGGIPAEFGDLSGGAVIITTHSYYTGMAQHQRMQEAAVEKEAAEKKAEDEKSGKRIEKSDEIIENTSSDSPNTPQNPTPQPEQKDEPKPENDQPKNNTNTQEAEQPK